MEGGGRGGASWCRGGDDAVARQFDLPAAGMCSRAPLPLRLMSSLLHPLPRRHPLPARLDGLLSSLCRWSPPFSLEQRCPSRVRTPGLSLTSPLLPSLSHPPPDFFAFSIHSNNIYMDVSSSNISGFLLPLHPHPSPPWEMRGRARGRRRSS